MRNNKQYQQRMNGRSAREADRFHAVSFSVYDLEKGVHNCIISGHGHIAVEMGIGNYLLRELKKSHPSSMYHVFVVPLFDLYNLYILYCACVP